MTGISGNRRLGWVLVLVCLAGLLAFGATRDPGPRTSADRVRSLGEVIRCPVCTGQSVAESDASTAREFRSEIATRVDEGQTDEQILAFFEDRYGTDVLLTPPADGIASLVWVLPVVVGVGGAFVVARTMTGASGDPMEPTAADRDLVDSLRAERDAGSS